MLKKKLQSAGYSMPDVFLWIDHLREVEENYACLCRYVNFFGVEVFQIFNKLSTYCC